MVTCTRCGYRLDHTDLKECPLCFTPLPTEDAAPQQVQPGAPPVSVVLPTQPQGGVPNAPVQQTLPQAMVGSPEAPPSSGIPGVAPAGGYMPPAQPPASPLMPPGVRTSLTGEVYEAHAQQGPPPSYVGGTGGLPPQPGAMPPPRPVGPSAPRPAASPYRRETAAPARSGGGGAIIAVVLVLLLLGGGGFGGYWWWTHRTNPKDQAQKFVDALKAQNYQAMYDLSDPASLNNVTEAEYESKLKQVFDLFPGLTESMKGLTYQVGEPTIEGDTAKVNVTMSGNVSLTFMGQSVSRSINQPLPLTLKNVGGIWKIDNDTNSLGGGKAISSKLGM